VTSEEDEPVVLLQALDREALGPGQSVHIMLSRWYNFCRRRWIWGARYAVRSLIISFGLLVYLHSTLCRRQTGTIQRSRISLRLGVACDLLVSSGFSEPTSWFGLSSSSSSSLSSSLSSMLLVEKVFNSWCSVW
jgi:hypothetical protein